MQEPTLSWENFIDFFAQASVFCERNDMFYFFSCRKTANIVSLSHDILPPVLHSNELKLKIKKYIGCEV